MPIIFLILQEMDLLEDDAVVYKLIGPALIKQEVTEAKDTVSKRLEYIAREMWVIANECKYCLWRVT